MAAGKYSFTIEQGATLDFELQYKDSAGAPVSLAGYSGRMQIRSAYADNNPTTYAILSSSLLPDGTGLNFSGSNGTTPRASGSIGVYISATSSSALTFSEAVYDLEIQSGSYVIRLLEGKVKLSKEVTR
ncbi:hypothetical protein UFOVP450_187 [uncultured Caudovirales phage]|uniref:Uncharacterized protein n=1 Tax=uncultured Caudovirales phage TaxID=2100421 RepID=A0A6J5MAD2_9CAUD|nr:hypothetical protein UFOVP450_187 [uncultured Caudovirales phage]